MIESFSVRDHAAWHRLRGKDVTASVAGALLGIHEFITPYELWMLKAGRLEADPEETAAMKRGRLLEPVAVELLREMRPEWVIHHNSGKGAIYFRDPDFRLGGTPDVMADANGETVVVQLKSVEQTVFRRKWVQEDGSVEPPLWIAVQATLEAYLTNSTRAFVAPLVIGHGIELPLIEVPLVYGIIDRLKELSLAFWKSVEDGVEPAPDFRLDGGTIDRLYARDKGDEVDLSHDARIEILIMARNRAIDAKRSTAKASRRSSPLNSASSTPR